MSSIKEDTEFVYTLSSTNNMVQEAIRSIKTLINYVEKNKIHIFYTPPHNKEDKMKLEALGVHVHEKNNITDGFRISGTSDKRYFGEKTRICDIKSKNVVFLDCDTLVLGNIWEVLEGDFEFKARPDTSDLGNGWEELFDKYEEEYMDWMPNAGFLVFKNETHKKIRNRWKSYLDKDIEYRVNGNFLKEQVALALSISEFRTTKMDNREHVFEGQQEKKADGIVYHISVEAKDTFPIDDFISILNKQVPFDLEGKKSIKSFRDWVVKK
jgi:hypothetical protein